MTRKAIHIMLLCLLLGTVAKAQTRTRRDSIKKPSVLVVPVLFRSPETRWAVGISGSVSFKTTHHRDSLTRTSNIQGIAMITQRHQNVEAIDATVYFPKESYIFYGQASHSYFPDNFWGIGPNTTDNMRERYVYEQVYIYPHLKKQIGKNLFAGILYEYQRVYNIHYQAEGEYASSVHYGKSPYSVSGTGGSLSYDTRNGSFWPTKGIFMQTSFTCFNQYFGSYYNDFKTVVDLRYFKSIFKNHVLAGQLFSYANSGQVPIREFAMLGGSSNLRGLYQGRFRDNNMVSAIAEYRAPIAGRFSACAFFGTGNVFKSLQQLETTTMKYAYGGGLRYAMLKKEKLNVRIDYGYSSPRNQGLYFTVGECF